jgi:hypothetical protein
MAVALGKPAPERRNEVGARIASIRRSVMHAIENLAPSPLRKPIPEAVDTYEEVDAGNDEIEQ